MARLPEDRQLPTADPQALRREVDAIEWWHRIDLGHGIVTPGPDDSPDKLATLRLPERLDGWSVADVGACDGFFSFEAERRGAERVVAFDSYIWQVRGRTGFDLARRVLGSEVEPVEMEVVDLSPEHGSFDLTLFLGVLYHLRDPLLALERVASITRNMLVLESHVDLLGSRRPAGAFYPGAELMNDPTNWWGLNPPAIEAMLRVVGFSRVRRICVSPLRRRLWDGTRLRLRNQAGFFASTRQGRAVFHAFKEA
jgi:tRNA (mo5U34)-methyltransferase